MLSARPRTCSHCNGSLIAEHDQDGGLQVLVETCLSCGRVSGERPMPRRRKTVLTTKSYSEVLEDLGERGNRPADDGWEVFDKRKAGVIVRISQHGQVTLSAAAYELLGKPDMVELLFNRSTRCIGLRKGTGPGAFVATKKNGPAVVGCKSFLQHYDIFGKKCSLKAQLEGNMLVAPLPKDAA